MAIIKETSLEDKFQRLFFRRQFLLGPDFYKPNKFWYYRELQQGLKLSVHADLPFYSETKNKITLILLGIAIDPYNPSDSESQILKNILVDSENLKDVIDKTNPLSGRWLIIFQDDKDSFIFNDLTGLRTLFYYSENGNIWCASQPELIKTKIELELTDDEEFLEFLLHPKLGSKESSIGGISTIYKNCFHLLPNFYLDINNVKQTRFYSGKEAVRKTKDEVVRETAKILQGIMKAAVSRYNIKLAVTGGLDSRVLLAASRNHIGEMKFYIDKMGVLTNNHADIKVPKKIAKIFGFNFSVENSQDDLPGWFISLLSNNVTGARVHPKTRSIYSSFLSDSNIVKINGNVSVIGKKYFRRSFNKNINKPLKNLNSEDLVKLFGYADKPDFLLREFRNWKDELELTSDNLFDYLDMFVLEQKAANWGALYPQEQDIAIEELSPFNCRLFNEIILSAPEEELISPGYPVFKELINFMWPELLQFPINPKPILTVENLREKVKIFIPDFIYQKLRYYKRKLIQ